MQNITIVGRLGRDAKLKESTNGQRFVVFTVAVNSKSRGAEKTTWYEVISFLPNHEKLVEYLTTGSVVIVTGELDASVQIGKDNVSYLRLSINADRIDFTPSSTSGSTETTAVKVEKKKEIVKEEEIPEDIPMTKAPTKKKAAPVVEEVPASTDGDDDLPF